MMLDAQDNDAVLAARRGTPTIIVNSVFVGVAWVSVILRIYTRARLVKVFYLEDWLMIVTALFFGVYCGTVIASSKIVTIGATETLTLGETLAAIQLLVISEIFYILTVLVLKISIGLFFLRIAIEKWQRYLIHSTIVLSTSFGVAMFFFACFQCGIYKNMLDFVTKRLSGQCASAVSVLGMTYTHAAITSLTDWIFVVLPLFVLRGSTMRAREKWTVNALMMLASVGAFASLVRFRFIPGLAVPGREFFGNSTNIAIWSCIEPGVGITAASIVCLRPMFRRRSHISTRPSGTPVYKSGKGGSYGSEMSGSVTHLRKPDEAYFVEITCPALPEYALPPSWSPFSAVEKQDRSCGRTAHVRKCSEDLPLYTFEMQDKMRKAKRNEEWEWV